MGPVYDGVKAEDVLQDAYDDFSFAYADMDKCGDMEDHAYYAGRVDALWELIYGFTHTARDAEELAKKTAPIMTTINHTPIKEITMNDQTATDLAETVLPETVTVARTLQSTVPFAAGVVVGVTAVFGAAYIVKRRKNSRVVVAQPDAA